MTLQRLQTAIVLLIGFGTALIPVDGIPRSGAFGELGRLLCFPPLALAVALSACSLLLTGPRPAAGSLRLAGLAVGLIAISALVNLPSIYSSMFHDRSGLEKLATSMLVIVFGFGVAAAAEALPLERLVPAIIAGVAISAIACLVYGAFELAAKHGLPAPGFTVADRLVHAMDKDVNAWDGSVNRRVVEGWDPRLRTLSFEPPAFGNFGGFAWPWLLFGVIWTRGWRRLILGALLALFTGLIVAAQARTGWLMLGANATIAVLLATFYFGSRSHPLFALGRVATPAVSLLALAAFAAHLATAYDSVVRDVVAGDSVSDLSRLASQVAAFRVFAGHPLLGVGLGQYAFHAGDAMPSWGYMSPEIWPNFTMPNAPWPTVYSMTARLAAELGAAGVLGWTALWVALAARVVAAQNRLAAVGDRWALLSYPLILNCAGVIVSGLATDTFRTPMMWLALGASCSLFRHARAARTPSSERIRQEALHALFAA